MNHHTSRKYQNIIHIMGTIHSFLMIFGAVIVGSGNIVSGGMIMVTGSVVMRISAELEYRKQTQLFKEFSKKEVK